MNEKFNKNAKVEQLTKMFLRRGEEKGLIVKDPLTTGQTLSKPKNSTDNRDSTPHNVYSDLLQLQQGYLR